MDECMIYDIQLYDQFYYSYVITCFMFHLLPHLVTSTSCISYGECIIDFDTTVPTSTGQVEGLLPGLCSRRVQRPILHHICGDM